MAGASLVVVAGRAGSSCGWRLTAALVGVLLAAGCAARLQLSPLDSSPALHAAPTELGSTDGASFISGVTVTLPADVDTATCNRGEQLLLAAYQSRPQGRRQRKVATQYVCYDLAQRQTRWAATGNPSMRNLREGVAVLGFLGTSETTSYRILDASTGDVIRDFKRVPFFADLGGDVLDFRYQWLGPYKCVRTNLRTGNDVWQYRLGDYSRDLTRDGDWVYSVGLNCLDAFKLSDGQGWRLSTPTSNSGEAGAGTAALAAAGCLFGLVSPITVMPTGSVIEHSFSSPLIAGDRVYFAARSKLLCLHHDTGDTIWQRPIPVDRGSMWLSQSGADLVLISLGWVRKNEYAAKASAPEVFLFSSSTGDSLAHFAPRSRTYEFVVGFRETDQGLYLLTTERLYRLDRRLELIGTLDWVAEEGWFLGFIASEVRLLARTERGVLAVDEAPLQAAWFRDLGGIPEPAPARPSSGPWGGGPVARADTFLLRWEATRMAGPLVHEEGQVTWFWTPRGLAAVDGAVADGAEDEIITTFSVGDSWKFGGFTEGAVVAMAGPQVMIADLVIDKERRTP